MTGRSSLKRGGPKRHCDICGRRGTLKHRVLLQMLGETRLIPARYFGAIRSANRHIRRLDGVRLRVWRVQALKCEVWA